MSFEYQTAKEGEEAGAPIYYGADPNQADQAIEDYGFLPSLMAPFSFQYDGWLKPADWHNYDPKLDGDAILSRAQGYNVYPDYDSIKQALVAGMADNAIVVPNGFWYSNWTPDINGILPMPNGSPISRHSYMFIDYKTINGTEYLVAQLSEGKQWGVGGTCYMSKECVNTAFASPLWNGLGCTIYRKSPATAITVKISIMQKLLVKLLELKDLLMGNI
ncbi:MAG: hypothetical protein KGL39_32875 [Patescibacteria group bacterium]|nr:hypothetical protein [Patescibacteria group bacterium]